MIKQRDTNDCGVAALAMYLHKTYEQTENQIRQLLNKQLPVYGMNREEVAITMRRFNKSPMTIYTLVPGLPAVVSVPTMGGSGSYHYVYFDGKDIKDPGNFKVYTNKDFQDGFPLSDAVVDSSELAEALHIQKKSLPTHLYNRFDWPYLREVYKLSH